jgi:PAS domain S-box-containing protein
MNGSTDSHFQSFDDAKEHSQREPTQRMPLETYLLGSTNVEHISQAFVALDQQWRVTYFSHQAAQLMQRTREEITGKNLWESFPELMTSPFYHHCQQAASSDKAAHIEVRSPRFQKWFHISIFPSPGEIAIFLTDITEQKKAEELAERSEKRFRALIENSVDAIALLDIQGTILYNSPSTTRILGYLPEDLIGQPCFELIHPDDLEHMRHSFDTIAKESGKSVYTQFRVRHKDGTFRWVKGSGLNLLDDQYVAAIVVNYHDITDRKHAIEERQMLAAIVTSSDDAIIGVTTEGIITNWNKGAERIYGYTEEEVIGKPASLLFPPGREDEYITLIQKIMKGETTDHYETLRRCKDGTIITISISVSPIKDATGAFIGSSSIARDITKQKRLEAEVQRAKQQLEVIFQNIADGIIVEDACGKIIYANTTAATLAGYTSVEETLKFSALAYWEQFDITDEEGHLFSLSRLPGSRSVDGNASTHANLRLLTKRTREVHWTSIKSTAVFDRNQTLIFVISVLQDITQFKELEQRKDEFIMHVSHELRTPLTAVSGYLELLQDQDVRLGASKKAHFLHQALENCYVLIELVNTVIDVLKINHDAKPVQREIFPVAPIMGEVIEQLDPRKRQEFKCQVDVPEDLTVYADKQYFCQVLRNLISNAFKYAPKHTPIIISAVLTASSAQGEETVPRVCISVQDTGPGIPPAEQPYLFQKFVRLKRDLTSSVRGTGLGLYICKELVEGMQGQIWIESSGKDGEGSRFSFTLPASPTCMGR